MNVEERIKKVIYLWENSDACRQETMHKWEASDIEDR